MKNKVIYAKCDSYNAAYIDKALEFIIENLDDFEDRVRAAKKILVKPNLISTKPPEKAVTTHPEVMISIINKIKHPETEIIIADTPAGKLNNKVMEKLYNISQMTRVSEITNTPLNWDFSDFEATSEAFKIAKSYKILNIAEEADLIINCAKLKTHCFTLLTCATKNLYGTIPGLLKMQYHLTMSQIEIFSNMLLDIERYFSPKTYHFVDGIIGLEGNGPTNGTPINSKCIIASQNPVYLDILACKIMGIDPLKIHTITEAKKRGIIKGTSFEDIEIVANNEVQTFKFKLPPERGSVMPEKVPDWVRNMVNNAFIPKPVVNKELCIGCKACEEICPPQLMKVIDGKAELNNYNSCIRCYCCQEVCPNNAIDLLKPAGRKLLAFFGIR